MPLFLGLFYGGRFPHLLLSRRLPPPRRRRRRGTPWVHLTNFPRFSAPLFLTGWLLLACLSCLYFFFCRMLSRVHLCPFPEPFNLSCPQYPASGLLLRDEFRTFVERDDDAGERVYEPVEPLVRLLKNFGIADSGNAGDGVGKKQLYETLVMRVTVPAHSSSWGINICPKDHKDFEEIAFHFNPRRRFVAMNNREANIWGQQVWTLFFRVLANSLMCARCFPGAFDRWCEMLSRDYCALPVIFRYENQPCSTPGTGNSSCRVRMRSSCYMLLFSVLWPLLRSTSLLLLTVWQQSCAGRQPNLRSSTWRWHVVVSFDIFF